MKVSEVRWNGRRARRGKGISRERRGEGGDDDISMKKAESGNVRRGGGSASSERG